MVIPVSEASVEYARRVRNTLRGAKLHVEVDASDRKMQKKVREAQLQQFNYILVRCCRSCVFGGTSEAADHLMRERYILSDRQSRVPGACEQRYSSTLRPTSIYAQCCPQSFEIMACCGGPGSETNIYVCAPGAGRLWQFNSPCMAASSPLSC